MLFVVSDFVCLYVFMKPLLTLAQSAGVVEYTNCTYAEG